MESSAIKIIEPEIQDLQASNGNMRDQVSALSITDDASFALGGSMLLEIKRRYKIIEDRFAESVSLAHKAHKALTTLRDSILSPLKLDEMTIKNRLGTYQMQIEKQRREEADQLRRQAEAKAEAERMAKAQEQMDKGDLKGCEKTLEAPLKVEPVRVVTPEAPKVAGVSFKDDWKFEITNVNELPLEYMIPDEKAIGRVIKALGAKANIPGIRIWSEKVVAGRV